MGVVHGHDPWSQCPACQQLWLEGEQWLWQMLPLLPFQVWMPNSSLLVGEEGKKAHATTAIWQVREQGPAGPPGLYALPSLNDFQDINTFSSLDGLKRQKERRCTAHSSHLCSSLGRGGAGQGSPHVYFPLPPWKARCQALCGMIWLLSFQAPVASWESTWGDEGRGWDHCSCPRDFEEAQLLREGPTSSGHPVVQALPCCCWV